MVSHEEIRMIQALTEAVFPDALEARVYKFILRDMRSNLFLVDLYRKGLNHLNAQAESVYYTNLLELDRDQLLSLLEMNEKSEFFQLVRNHTLEGMFSDPIYGGNYEAYGWRLLGYEGPVFHPPETLDEIKLPTVYYSLEGIAYEEK